MILSENLEPLPPTRRLNAAVRLSRPLTRLVLQRADAFPVGADVLRCLFVEANVNEIPTCAAVTPDIRPRAVRNKLPGQGLVFMDAAGRDQLKAAAFPPRPGSEDQLFYSAGDRHDDVMPERGPGLTAYANAASMRTAQLHTVAEDKAAFADYSS
jgi:hypothetical protein